MDLDQSWCTRLGSRLQASRDEEQLHSSTHWEVQQTHRHTGRTRRSDGYEQIRRIHIRRRRCCRIHTSARAAGMAAGWVVSVALLAEKMAAGDWAAALARCYYMCC